MKLRSGKITDAVAVPVAPVVPVVVKAPTQDPRYVVAMEINNTTVGLWENGRKFVCKRGGQRDWHLNVYKDKHMMLVLHSPYTSVDYFENKPAKITYDDETLSVMIKRPVVSYHFKFEDEAEYQTFKNLKMEEIYNE